MNFFRTQASQGKLAILIFLCAVPILGGIVGVLLIISGLVKKDRVFIIIGIGGMVVTATIVGVLSYQARHRGHFDEARRITARHNLSKMVRTLELYKLNYSKYPDQLLSIKEIDGSIIFSDPLQQVHPKGDQSYYYQLIDSGYYLFSRGFDAKAVYHR